MKEQAFRKTFNRELMGALAVYAVILMVSLSAGKSLQPGLARTLVMLSPMIGFMLALWVMVRQMARMDEFLRRTNLAMAAAITAGLSFTYGFLELAGFPKLSMFSVWCVLGGAWASITFLRCRVRFG
jgi:hypothetical protein